MKWLRSVLWVWVIVVAGCGGGGEAEFPAGGLVARERALAVPNVTGPGEFKSVTRLGIVPLADIQRAAAEPGSRTAGLEARYGVTAYRISYLTTDGDGREVLASGLVAVPDKPAGRLSPALLYQHGTIFKDAQAPSNAIAPAEGPIAVASVGYIVIAADYVGYGVSRGTSQHPYLMSAPTAAAVLDLLRATHHWHDTQGATAGALCNGQIFLLGYSEGGYATMAAHRAMQAAASPYLPYVVSAVAGAGPYHVGITMDTLLQRVKDENVVLGALIDPGFLRYLGSTVRNEVRRLLVKQLIPDNSDVAFDTRFIDAQNDGDPTTQLERYAARARLPDGMASGTWEVMVSRDGGMTYSQGSIGAIEIRPNPMPPPTFTIGDPAYSGSLPGGCHPNDGIDDTLCFARVLHAATDWWRVLGFIP